MRVCVRTVVAISIVAFATSQGSEPFYQRSTKDAFAPEVELLPKRGIWSRQPAKYWQEALVTGNGTLGAMVYGDPASERIVLNHERLYEPLLDEPCSVPDISRALPEVRRLLLAGEYKQAYRHSYQSALEAGFPGIQWTDPYHPACVLVIEQDIEGEIREYWRSIDFETGEVSVHWKTDQGSFSRQTFASRANNVIVHRVVGPEGKKVSGRIRLVNQDRRPPGERVDEKGGGYHEPVILCGNTSLFSIKYRRTGRGYHVLMHVDAGEEGVRQDGDWLAFNTKNLLIWIDVTPQEKWSPPNAFQLSQVSRNFQANKWTYDQLLSFHAKIHSEMFGRVHLDLGGGEDRWLSSEELIAKQKTTAKTRLQPALLEKAFDMGRYTLISSSGEWPPNLMGIWNGDWRPDWSGDFTLDANVNLQIASANLGNLPEAIESYSNLIIGLQQDWRVNANNLFGCSGLLSGCRTDGRHNLHTHFSDGFPGHLWTAGAQWLVLPMFEYYQTTGDEEFLHKTLLPLMEGIVEFYVDFLKDKDENGKRIFVPSYSPENHPSNTKCPATINATMDIACAKEALTNLIDVAEKHALRSVDVAKCYELLDELPSYLINEEGALKEWSWPGLEDRYDHRHVSHLYPVWPGHEINPEDTPDLFRAATIAATKKGRGNGSAHGLAHMALIGARLKDAELVFGNLKFMLSENYLLPSLFTFHNPNRIYNSDMLHSLPAVVMEMLVYSRPGEIELLPALSDQIPTGGVQGVCCRNQAIVKELYWNLDKKSLKAVIESRVAQSMNFRLRRGIRSVHAEALGNIEVIDEKTFTVELPRAEPLILSIKLR